MVSALHFSQPEPDKCAERDQGVVRCRGHGNASFCLPVTGSKIASKRCSPPPAVSLPLHGAACIVHVRGSGLGARGMVVLQLLADVVSDDGGDGGVRARAVVATVGAPHLGRRRGVRVGRRATIPRIFHRSSGRTERVRP